jgi:hypothetical protein
MTKMHLAPPPTDKPPARTAWGHVVAFVFLVGFAAAVAFLF